MQVIRFVFHISIIWLGYIWHNGKVISSLFQSLSPSNFQNAPCHPRCVSLPCLTCICKSYILISHCQQKYSPRPTLTTGSFFETPCIHSTKVSKWGGWKQQKRCTVHVFHDCDSPSDFRVKKYPLDEKRLMILPQQRV